MLSAGLRFLGGARNAQASRTLLTGARRTLTSPAPVRMRFGYGRFVVTAGLGAATLATWASTQTDAARNKVYDIPIGPKAPVEVPCFIEVSQGSRNKYEWDNENEMLTLDRVLHSAVFYPHNYGFIPQTLCGDGDPLDVLVMGDSALQPGSIVQIRPIGYMVMEDEKGLDEKVLAVVLGDPHYNDVRSLRDVNEHVLREIAHFFETYKALENKKWVKVGGWKGLADTKSLIISTHETYFAAKAAEHVSSDMVIAPKEKKAKH